MALPTELSREAAEQEVVEVFAEVKSAEVELVRARSHALAILEVFERAFPPDVAS